jgi:hypothetical protein
MKMKHPEYSVTPLKPMRLNDVGSHLGRNSTKNQMFLNQIFLDIMAGYLPYQTFLIVIGAALHQNWF